VKLARVLQSQGFGTRRECTARVTRGEVALAGVVCTDPDAEFDPAGLEFEIDGARWRYRALAHLVLHKPVGYECSHKPIHHPSVYSLLPLPLRVRGVQCVGRLDQDTTGLLLLTDDGHFVHRITSPKKHYDKIYLVTCKHAVDDAQLAALCAGVVLHDAPEPVAALAALRMTERVVQLTIAEGKYHQVKRMVAAAGNRVEALHRIVVGGYTLPTDLAAGEWRWLDAAELAQLEIR
jgi:16S rRNA pseudouridine516 synthase